MVVVSDPFHTDLINAVRFAAQGPVRFVLAPAEDISKAYEKYYGVGAETIDELAQDEVDDEEDLELMFSDDKEIAEGDQEPVSSNSSTKSSGRLTAAAQRTSILSRTKMSCRFAIALMASCTKCRCRRRSRSCRRH